jgi:thiol:disulfide interchange protein
MVASRAIAALICLAFFVRAAEGESEEVTPEGVESAIEEHAENGVFIEFYAPWCVRRPPYHIR